MWYDDAMATKKKDAAKLGWHFLPSNMKLGYGDDRVVKVGQSLSMKGGGNPNTCNPGMHASVKASDAARFKKGPVLCRVEVSGDIADDGDKFCGRHRKVLWARALTAQDIKDMLKSMGYSHSSSTLGELVDTMGYAVSGYGNAAKIDTWLTNWAKKNGCTDGAYQTTAVFVKPSITEKHVLSLITRRMVRTSKEIRNDLSGTFDMDGFDTILDDLCCDGKVIQVDGYTEAGLSGYVLAATKR